MPNKPAKSASTLHSGCPEGANTCIQETVKEPLNGQLFIHKCDMGCPFRNCLTSCSRSDVKNSNVQCLCRFQC